MSIKKKMVVANEFCICDGKSSRCKGCNGTGKIIVYREKTKQNKKKNDNITVTSEVKDA